MPIDYLYKLYSNKCDIHRDFHKAGGPMKANTNHTEWNNLSVSLEKELHLHVYASYSSEFEFEYKRRDLLLYSAW